MARIDDKLAALVTMSPAQLRQEWQRLEQAPCPRLGSSLLRQMVGHKLQERAHGGLPARDRRKLAQLLEGGRSPLRLKPGTRLMRGWNGRTVSVLVTEDGFLFEDRSYNSLSAIAREVTGATWSGPRFFGLKASSNG